MLLQMALFCSYWLSNSLYMHYCYIVLCDDYYIVYMYHIFSIHSSVIVVFLFVVDFVILHSSVDGCLDCFHIFAIVNSAAVNIGVHVIFLAYSFVKVYAQEWNCWIMVILSSVF